MLDSSLAPPGCHVIHAYAAANEVRYAMNEMAINLLQPYDLWVNVSSRADYKALKNERCEFLWKAIERSIPDVRKRTKVVLDASPITHER